MHPIEQEFAARGLEKPGLLVLPPAHAVALIERCREAGISILGLEAFRVFSGKVQPVMEAGSDYSGKNRLAPGADCWGTAISHIQQWAGEGFHFEVVIDAD